MASRPQPATPSRPQAHVEHFWQRVSEGLELNQLWSQFEKDARSGYRLYSAGLSERAEGESGFRRFWLLTKALFWAILEKLTPARRVLLLLALILLFFPVGEFSYTGGAGPVKIQLNLNLWGGLLMFVVLLLELAD